MTITFNTNLSALTSQRYIGISSGAASSSLAKLSSGSRIPQAKDDAAGLAIGSKLRAEVAGLTTASNNASQAISLLQIADGALSTIGDMLVRMKALATQSSSGQLGDAERSLLNQEFINLKNEIDRIAVTSNFNGTTLLAGSTIVTSNVNDLAAYSATNGASSSANLLGNGFQAINFSQDYGDGAVRVEYNATSRVMTVTDLVNAKSESITLAAGNIANGSVETYNFGNIGVSFTLNHLFDKGADINPVNQAYFSPAAANFTVGLNTIVGAGTAGAATVGTLTTNFAGTGANTMFTSQLDAAVFTVGGTAAAATLGNVTIGGHVFTTAGATQDLTSAGAKTWTYSDGLGNSFTVGFTADGNAAGAMSGTISLAQTAGGTIENSAAGSASIVSIGLATTEAARFDFGTVDNARVVLDATTAAATVASIVINGQTFTSANTVGGGVGADLTTTGTKTITLANTNVADTANTITLTFNVTAAFTNGDAAQLDMAQFGQLVGANSSVTANTAFSFKVGTGTTVDDSIGFSLNSATTVALGINGDDIENVTAANTAIDNLNLAINTVSSRRADVGANQSRLEFAAANISVAIENTTAATSSIMDVDVAAEITEFTSKNVLLQAGISLLAQANQQPSLLLSLLQ